MATALVATGLHRHLTYEEAIGELNKDYRLRVPRRKALEVASTARIQQLRDGLEGVSTWIKQLSEDQGPCRPCAWPRATYRAPRWPMSPLP